ncbi:Uu.00g072070.m01.CDS01 [Anthostomella pinea]|uniref:Uu.00g072070.m01.CDS01 n=1 Tax=Anthostomella pinea TaxID=933095 RepID=A0AAI8YLE9_9PEZI|nr:Uu.00g072070.m01.CDS01 [Anthostomella pinea]
MQKILRRVATAERVAAKRKKAKDLKFYKKEKKESVGQSRQQLGMVREDFERAKRAIRDDWALGPLAPRNDVGEWDSAHGTVHEARFRGQGGLSLAMRNRRCQWAGGAYNLNIAVGDRVVLLDGPDKGRIGLIREIDPMRAEVVVADLNKSNIRIAQELRPEGDEKTAALNIELPIPISSIRLVHPMKDPTTGVTKDVIINQLVHGSKLHDRVSGKKAWKRVVPGLNVNIPWPRKGEDSTRDTKADTLRIDVEAKTFVPTLLRPPMPETVIDELRGRYSRFRTRHEPEYIARLEAEAQAKKDRAKLMESMRTPLQELHRAERANNKKKGKPRLTVEMLEKIGEVIAKNRERTLNAAGVSGAGRASTSGSGGGLPPAPQVGGEGVVPPTIIEPTSQETAPPSPSA